MDWSLIKLTTIPGSVNGPVVMDTGEKHLDKHALFAYHGSVR